ncbi:MAG: ribosome maturation factor RimM [Eubacteriales bacterium]
MKNTLVIGRITSPHGIIGEVNVYPLTDDPQRFSLLKNIIINGAQYQIEKVRYQNTTVILKLDGLTNRNGAETLKNAYIEIPREDGVSLQEDQYFIVDLIGLKVYEKAQQIGILKDIIQSGSTDIYVIAIEEQGEIMVPAIKEYILDINIDDGKMEVDIPQGLKEL